MNDRHIHLYGIANCDRVRKARRWLEQHGACFTFHDFSKEGVDTSMLDAALAVHGWQVLLNRRGTTWRRLDEETRKDIDATRARQLMLEQPSVIKRPVLLCSDRVLVGFDEAAYAGLLPGGAA